MQLTLRCWSAVLPVVSVAAANHDVLISLNRCTELDYPPARSPAQVADLAKCSDS